MTILLPALSAALAAFCAWLTVRIVNRKERWAKRTLAAVLVGVLVGYPLSWGVFIRMWLDETIPPSMVPAAKTFYVPIDWMDENGPQFISDALNWWANLCVRW